MSGRAFFAHETAIVEDNASVGEGTKIWHHAHVRSGAQIGRDCTLGKNVFVDEGARVGSGVKIQNNVSVYTGVELEDGVFVGPSAVFTNDRNPRADGADWRLFTTLVHAGATIGANATIVAGVEIGSGALVAAGAVVTRSVESNELVGGNPARHMGWVCACGNVVSRDQVRPAEVSCPACADAGADDNATIPITSVRLGAEEEALVLQVLRSGQLAQGPVVARLERDFCEFTGARHAVAVNSGSAALVVALEALGIGAADEVITTPLTFAASLNAILAVGATARFVDITEEDYNLDASRLEAAITPRTRAVMPVHLYGQPADMKTISDVADRHGIAVVEDAAQAHGSRIGARHAGTFGSLGCFSFYATKAVTAGEGGIVVTDDDALAERMRVLRNVGMSAAYTYESLAQNLRMSDVHAAIAIPQLARVLEQNERRRRNADRLTEGLKDIPGLRTPVVAPGRTSSFHQYTVAVTADAARTRDETVDGLTARGIGCRVYYPRAVYDYDCYREHPGVVIEPMPRAERAASQVLSLPVHPWLADAELQRIISAVHEVLGA